MSRVSRLQAQPQVQIRTLSLRVGNYGGIWQAYALQYFMRANGISGVTDVSIRHNKVSASKRHLLSAKQKLFPSPWTAYERQLQANRQISDWVDERIDTNALFVGGSEPRPDLLRPFAAFVVGSDQVWRPQYADVGSYLFDFLPPKDPRPRIAFSASFGVHDAGSLRVLSSLRPLARRLDAVSVREHSGVELCKQLWGVEAIHTADPAFLLRADEYRSILSAEHPQEAVVATYLLNASDRKLAVARSVASEIDAGLYEVGGEGEPGSRPRDLPARVDPAEWLRSLMNAAAVVTDSFHGLVFALIFNKPFVAFVNSDRGAERFHSLIHGVGLDPRYASTEQQPILSPWNVPWSRVNDSIEHQRRISAEFLRAQLIDRLR